MKRKIFPRILSILIVFCSLTQSVCAASVFSFSDLNSFGISSMTVERKSAPACDGILSEGEYGIFTAFSENKGLYSLSNGKYDPQILISNGTVLESAVVLSGNMIFCALRFSGDEDPVPIKKNGLDCFRVSFSLGLTPGDHPALRGSMLSNTYYFSASDFTCVGFIGERVARSVHQNSVATKPINSFSSAYAENGVVTSDGAQWNAARYLKSAAFSLKSGAQRAEMVAEVCIPLEDALLSVHPSERDVVASLIRNDSQPLCGGFSAAVDLNERVALTVGLPSNASYPGFADGQELFSFLASNFEKPLSGIYVPEVIPIPFYWCGTPTQKAEASVPGDSLPSFEPESKDDTSSVGALQSVQTQVPATSSVQLSEDQNDAEEDESVFDSLPDSTDRIPEDTEILYDEKVSATSKKEQNDTSLASSILAAVTGALLFASVMVICIYFRDSDKKKKEEEEEARKKKRKKNSKKES